MKSDNRLTTSKRGDPVRQGGDRICGLRLGFSKDGQNQGKWRTKHILKARIVLCTLFALFAASRVWGDVTGSISGNVMDSTGAVVPGAAVVATCTETGIEHSTRTNGQGFYSFPLLPLGHYDVKITGRGFKEYVERGLVIDVNSALRVDATLQIGEVTQEVSVTANPLQVETTSSQMGEVIETTKVTGIPLNGRSYTDLLALQPGVVPTSTETSGSGPNPVSNQVSGNLNPGDLSISGQRESANGFMVNGGSVQERLFNGTAVIPDLDSIAEFRILTNNADAEYGNYSGGLVNVITKSGTNALHGSAFECTSA